jgi:hypothetical protein
MRDNTPVDARMTSAAYDAQLNLSQDFDTFMARYQ